MPIAVLMSSPVSNAVEEYQGAYSGGFSGDEVGIWIAVINDHGDVRLVLWSYDAESVDGGEEISIDNGGILDGYTVVCNRIINGYVAESGSLIAKWLEQSAEGLLEGLRENNVSQFVGVYSGWFNGDESGEWDLTIHADGSASCTLYRKAGNIAMKGCVNSSGTIILYDDNGWGMNGTILKRKIDGTWTYPAEEKKGRVFQEEEDDDEPIGCFISIANDASFRFDERTR
ncbi:MAG: hypothetical protein JW932_01530 [Deltaproteobacteria bacterium]|nr:hypothetical protein [Deltaproteobacteria bacterium]